VRGEAGSEGDGGAPWRLRAGVRITTQDRIMKIQAARKFILTGRRDYKFPTINISDHMNVNRLIGMVKHCAPSAVITYHPGGACPLRLAAHLNKMGYYARALEEINTVIGI
jgi:putative mRNA 3-end processing factor